MNRLIQIEEGSIVLSGLKDVIKEQEFLLESFHKNSRKGLISVRIPRDQNPAKDYWVSLEPTELNVDKDEMQLQLIDRNSGMLAPTILQQP